MLLWKVYHPVGAYSAQDKKEFAEKVTAMYSGIPIPKFYVVMIFEEVAAESFYVGGASHGNSFVSSRGPDQLRCSVRSYRRCPERSTK
jgi:phenylpyruvate tautomerase PptA (4-oxalocrotonate tautomerase family)